MPTGLDLAKAVDTATDALAKFLRANGPLYRPSDSGNVWIYAADLKSPFGFTMFSAGLASSVSTPDDDGVAAPVPLTPIAPMPMPPPMVVPALSTESKASE